MNKSHDFEMRDKIFDLRMSLGLSSPEIAKKLGISRRAVSLTMQVFQIVSEERWDDARRIVENRAPLSVFQWASQKTGVLLPPDMQIQIPKIMTVKEYADLKNVSPVTVYGWIKRGKLKSTKKFNKVLGVRVLHVIPENEAPVIEPEPEEPQLPAAEPAEPAEDVAPSPAAEPGQLSEAAKAIRREYHRKYREEHKEQIEENRRRYWEKKGAELRAEEQKDAASSIPQEAPAPEPVQTEEKPENKTERFLKPCPFCGSDAELFPRDTQHGVIVFVKCSYCDAQTRCKNVRGTPDDPGFWEQRSIAQVIRLWNKRVNEDGT